MTLSHRTFNIDDELWILFQEHCRTLDMNATQVLNRLIFRELSDKRNIEFPFKIEDIIQLRISQLIENPKYGIGKVGYNWKAANNEKLITYEIKEDCFKFSFTCNRENPTNKGFYYFDWNVDILISVVRSQIKPIIEIKLPHHVPEDIDQSNPNGSDLIDYADSFNADLVDAFKAELTNVLKLFETDFIEFRDNKRQKLRIVESVGVRLGLLPLNYAETLSENIS